MSIAPTEVREELDRILGNPLFKPKRNMCRLLEHLVTETLEGRSEDLKGYSIALDVFRQPSDYDSDRNPLVRVNAGRLRTLLRLYYLGDGKQDPIRIEVPTGTYVPTFSANLPDPAKTEPEPSHPGRSTPRNTIAVVPFRNLSGRSDLDFFGAAFAQDLSDALFRHEDYRVIAMNERGEDEAAICKRALERGIAFLVDGNVQAMGPQVRISVKVLDTDNEMTIWASPFSFNMEAEDAFEARERIIEKVAVHVLGEFGHINRALLSGLDSNHDEISTELSAMLQAFVSNPDLSPESLHEMQEKAEAFLELDPNSALLHALLADKLGANYVLDVPGSEGAFEKLGDHAERAYALDPDNQYVRSILAMKCFHYRERDRFFHLMETSVESAAPSLSRLAQFATCACFFGEWERGMQLLDRLMANSPRIPEYLHGLRSVYFYRRQDYELALEEANKDHTPGFFWAPLFRCVILSELGRLEDAMREYQNLFELRPDFESRGRFLISRIVIEEDLLERFLQAFERIGVHIERA